MLTPSPFPLVRDSAEPAFDQVNAPRLHRLVNGQFETDKNVTWPGHIYSTAPNWNDETLSELDDGVAHLTLHLGELNEAVIATVKRLEKLTSLELVGVDIPSRLGMPFIDTLRQREVAVERMYYSGFDDPTWMNVGLKCISSKLYMKIVGFSAIAWGDAPGLQRLDARAVASPSVLPMHRISLMHGKRLLDTLILEPSQWDARKADALKDIPVRNLILADGTFDDSTALALEGNTHLESVTLMNVPLKREWVQQLLRMPNIQSLTLVRPKPFATVGARETTFEPMVNQDFVSGLSRRDQGKVTFKDRA